MSTASSMEAEALKRKERLLMMKRKMAATNEGEVDSKSDSNSEDSSAKRPAFRSYKPADASLQKDAVVVPPAEPVDVETHVLEQIESAKEISTAGDIDIATLAPRKIDWDLKRDAEKKLQKLDRRTQAAIAELIRERLASGKEDLLLSAVNSRARVEQDRHLSDDEDD